MTIITKKVTVPTAGTPVQLGTEGGTIVELNIEGLADNVGDVHVGGSDVLSATKTGLSLGPQDTYSEDDDGSRQVVAGRKMEDIFVDAENNGDGVSVFVRLRDN